jgi:drug/metabolite transporter (DMT)-like permease
MLHLLFVSLVWAFSFGLIKTSLAGVDPNFVAAARLGLALLVFVPFFRPRAVDRRTALRLMLVGAVQYGGMYIAYLYAFRYLQAYEVALFTILTPLYVTLIHDWTERRIQWISLAAVSLAVIGTWITQSGGWLAPSLLTGFWIVQISNVCFAYGQIDYRRVMAGKGAADGQVFALPYLGGFLTAAVSAFIFADRGSLVVSGPQVMTLVYLGVVASGLCFFLWNAGARRVDAGTLAIFNDLKIPLAAVVSLTFFGEQVDVLRLLLGGGLAAAALLLNAWNLRRKMVTALA